MKMILKSIVAAAILAMTFGISAAGTAFAGPSETALLESFVGNWRGSSTLTGGEEPETFTCRMTMASGTGAKVNFAGRCSLIGMNLAVNGTVAYSDENRRFEGAMTSNTAYSGLAVGRKQGDRVIFDFNKRNLDESGRDLTIGSTIILDADKITVEFVVTFNSSGEKMNASVPFDRI